MGYVTQGIGTQGYSTNRLGSTQHMRYTKDRTYNKQDTQHKVAGEEARIKANEE